MARLGTRRVALTIGTVVAGLPVALLLCATPTTAARFEISAESGSTVRFESRAPMETFDGRTDRVSGYVIFDPEKMSDSITVLVEVDLASLDTGIKKRNEHMRERHLETDRYPTARFSGATVLSKGGSALSAGTTVSLDIEGDLELHGVKKRLRIPVEVTLAAAGSPSVYVKGSFNVNLSDFNISRPRFLFMKLGEEQQVTIDLKAHAAASE